MAKYQHPGIYIEEVPGARSIQGVSTSVPAFIGVTEMGDYEKPTLITSWSAFTRQFGNLIWYGYVPWAVYEFFNEGGSSCYVVRAKDKNSGKPSTAKLNSTTLTAVTAGEWGNSLKLMISNSSSTDGVSPVFKLSVVVEKSIMAAAADDFSGQLLKSYVTLNNLSAQTISNNQYYTLEEFNGFTTLSAAFAQRVNSSSMFIRAKVSDSGKPGARPGNTKTPTAFNSGSTPVYQFETALETLKKVQGISLLSMPDTVTATDSSGKVTEKGQATLINQNLLFCEGLGSIFYVSEPPLGLDVQGILKFKTGTGTSVNGGNQNALNSSYGAIYYPWVWIFNPLSNSNVPIPPSGPVLGRYANTDQNSGVFKSPAGVTDGALKTVVDLESQVTDSDQDNINPEGINAIRNLINYGNVIWGARTLSSDSQWTYVAVRRLFIYVEQSLKQSLQWVVFEPNDQQLWSSVSRDISAFLTILWQQGGLFGSTAQEAYFVTCDASNNPPETRALGQLYVDIGLAAVYPAEFVVIRITQKTAGPDSGA